MAANPAGDTSPSTGWSRNPRWLQMKSGVPSTVTCSGGMASSSAVSRRAHCSTVSPASIRPPGKHTSPCWRSPAARTSNSRCSAPSRSTRGQRTA